MPSDIEDYVKKLRAAGLGLGKINSENLLTFEAYQKFKQGRHSKKELINFRAKKKRRTSNTPHVTVEGEFEIELSEKQRTFCQENPSHPACACVNAMVGIVEKWRIDLDRWETETIPKIVAENDERARRQQRLREEATKRRSDAFAEYSEYLRNKVIYSSCRSRWHCFWGSVPCPNNTEVDTQNRRDTSGCSGNQCRARCRYTLDKITSLENTWRGTYADGDHPIWNWPDDMPMRELPHPPILQFASNCCYNSITIHENTTVNMSDVSQVCNQQIHQELNLAMREEEGGEEEEDEGGEEEEDEGGEEEEKDCGDYCEEEVILLNNNRWKTLFVILLITYSVYGVHLFRGKRG